MTTVSYGTIDLSILLIFRLFCPSDGEDMAIGVCQYAEHEYDNRFVRHYRFIDFIDFSLFLPGPEQSRVHSLVIKIQKIVVKLNNWIQRIKQI